MSLMKHLTEIQEFLRDNRGVVVYLNERALVVEVRGTRTARREFLLEDLALCRINPVMIELPQLYRQAGGVVWPGTGADVRL